MVTEAAVINGYDIHAFHVADGDDGLDGIIDFQYFPGVVSPLV